MPLRPLPFREVRRKLEAAGFVEVSRRGSHVKFVRQAPDRVWVAIVPDHRELAVGTLRTIVRQAGITVEEFERL